MSKFNMISAGFVATLAIATAGEANAYSYNTCLGEKLKWSSNSKTMRASGTSFPAGYWRNGLQDAINKFNQNPSKSRYALAVDGGGVGRDNGESEIWGDTGAILNGAPAIAYTWWTCYWLFGNHVHLDELDVIFDYTQSPWRWTANNTKSSLSAYTGSLRQLQTTAIHELGHGLALNHVNSEYNVMGRDYEHIHVNGAAANAYLGEDAADGAVFLYGATAGAFEDVGVVHWKYAGAAGEYSDHTKTRVTNGNGAALATVNVGGETGYRVNRGQSVQAEFTFENNGKTQQNGVNVGYYISTNDTITTLDRRIATQSLNIGRGNVMTYAKTVTIPANLLPNTNYWLGVIVDYTGTIAEGVESNNATYIPIRVQ